ncbi:hypothetical protein SESBI_39446 [Sesbania bispinosa]|nr:hypothetical protein SESBI_39446 [Sesbania bispinosa]
MASSSNPDGGSQDSPPQENKKKIRGICKMKHVTQSRKEGIKLKIGWNSRGQLIDPNKSTFSYYVGWITRSTMPIIYSDLGEEIFEVTEEHKNFILSFAGRDARAFRSRLRKKFLMDDDGNLILQPPEKYARLNTVANYWMDFVNQSSTEDFKKESKENAEKAKRMTLRYRRSAKGYAQLEQDMENLTQTIPQEQFQTMGKGDILSRALGVPEHPGRTQSTPQMEWQQKVQQWMTHITRWLSHISGGQGAPFMHMPGQPPFMPMPGQTPCMPMPGQLPSMSTAGQPPSMSAAGQPPSTPAADQPASTPAVGQPASTPVVGQPSSTPAVGQPASTPVVGQPASTPAAVQSHEEGSPLPVPIEDENLMTHRDAIGTYVSLPRSLIHLAPQGPPPSSKGKGKEHFWTKEYVTSPMKGSIQRIIHEEFASASALYLRSLQVLKVS